MLDAVGNLGAILGIVADDMSEAVNETLLAYGADAVTDATDIGKLRALARIEAWRVAVAKSAGSYEFTANNATFKRAQIHTDAQAGLLRAESEAARRGYASGGYVGVTTVTYANDPHRPATYYETDDLSES
jgi:hypothetical protein